MGQEDKTMFKWIAVIALIIVVVTPIIHSVKVINPGETAVATRFGSLNGLRREGIHFALFENLTVYNLKTTRLDARHETGSKDGQYIYVDTAFTYTLKGESLDTLFQTIGSQKELEEKFIVPVIRDTTYQVAAQYTADEILPKQKEFREQIFVAIKERMVQTHINIGDLQIIDIDFKPEYNAALEAKQIAEQNAIKDKQVAVQELERKKIELESTRIEAERQRLLQTSLSQQLLTKQWIEKWDGKLPTTLTGDSTLLNIPVK